MTAREKKAVELEREKFHHAFVIGIMTDEQLLLTDDVQTTLRGMEWQAEQCAIKAADYYEDEIDDGHQTFILNAGTEEVVS